MSLSLFKTRLFHSYIHDPSAIAGSVIIAIFIFLAIAAPWVAPQNPYDLETVSLDHFLKPPIWMEGGEAPFLLGTDDQGRGILSTIIYGCRTSIIVGFGVVLIAGSFGVLMGLLSGFYGGWSDVIIMRFADTFFAYLSA